MNKSLIIVGGPAGAGKSTLLSQIKGRQDTVVASTGDMYKIASDHVLSVQGVNYEVLRDDIKKYQISYLRNLEPLVMTLITGFMGANHGPKTNVVLDTHYSVGSAEGFANALKGESISLIGATASVTGFDSCHCILVDADTAKIYERVNSDGQRSRGTMAMMDIEAERNSNASAHEYYAEILGNHLDTLKHVIHNNELRSAHREFLRILERPEPTTGE
ncbi:MAG: AAA family ATPase [Candidatus Micrarchaeota archaeon]|nr:AAA family ATPase [Candidatus Micrarchaeota archaeon]